MPKMNGFELLRALKTNNRYSHIPVIVASASAFEKDKRASFDAGADAFLSKPVEINKVLLTVCQILKIDAKEINKEIYQDEVKAQSNTYSNEKILVLDVIEQKKALEIISLAELGNFPEIRKILINTESQGIQSLNLFIQEELTNFDAEGVIKKIELVLSENEQ
jgi:CheY-like chemotaxis protein